jgi:hypothetical protein
VALAFLGADGKVIRELKGEVQNEPAKPKELRAETPAAGGGASRTEGQTVATPAEKPERSEAIKSEGGPAEQNPTAEATPAEPEEEESGRGGAKDGDKLKDIVNGHNRVSWDLRYPDAKKFPGMILWAGGTTGPKVLPGSYQARLTVGDQVTTVPFEVRLDPRTTATTADLKAQFDFVTSAYNKLSEVNGAVARMREVRKDLTDIKKRAGASKEAKDSKPDAGGKAVVDAATALDKKMTAIEETLYQTKNHSSQDPLNNPIRLNDKLAGVADSASTGSSAPTAQQIAVRDQLVTQIDVQLAALKAIWDTDLPAFNKLVRDQNIPAIK